MSNTLHRYNSAMITLHWIMAAAFFIMLGSGICLEYIELDKSFKFQLYQWHKSGGVLLLIAIALRITIKIFSKKPPFPTSFSKKEKLGAHAGHIALYLAMIAMVSSGWLMVSSSVYGLPTIVFGWFEWPHIPNLQGNNTVNNLSKNIHFYGFISFITLILGHIGAVILHYKKEHINLITRMWWHKSKIIPLLFIATALFTPSQVIAFEVNQENGTVQFKGEHAGNSFSGIFQKWAAHINLEAEKIEATFYTDTAFTDNPMYDGTLPTADWFNSKVYPTAHFRSIEVQESGDNTYSITGILKIKDIEKNAAFTLNMQDEQTGNLSFTLNRLNFDLGKKSDPSADWVEEEVQVSVKFKTTP